MSIKIAVTEDHPLMLKGICDLLNSYDHLEVIDRYLSGAALLEGLTYQLPDVLLLDLSLPDKTGNELVRIIGPRYPGLRILILSSIDTPYQIKDMMQGGCSGYLLKSAAPEVLVRAIEEVCEGRQFLDPLLKEQMLGDVFGQTKSKKLTNREKEILTLICQGETNVGIAQTLFLAQRTVENHRFSLYKKFDVKNTAALVRVALQQGLID